MTERLRRRWELLLPGRRELGAALVQRWSEPHRRYHDLSHLELALTALDQLGGLARAEQLALWFHDAVHTGSPVADEHRSAELAATLLPGAGLPRAEVEEVSRLVLVTIDHRPLPEDLPGARVSDADLAVLAADPAAYQASVAALRAEAAGLSDAAWVAGRVHAVRSLLASPRLFHTELGSAGWELRARMNLTAELETYPAGPVSSR